MTKEKVGGILNAAFKFLGLAGIIWVGSIMLQVRDAVKDAPKLRKEVDAHERQLGAVNEKIRLILLNDENFKIPTNHLRPTFRDIDKRANDD